MATMPAGSQNNQCQERFCTMGPAVTMPTPAPMPKMADSRPMVTLTRSLGSSSRMMPIEAEAGVSTALVNRYFGSKEGLCL